MSEKFRLFDGVFGASDEVLGAIESGVDFERRIAAIYQECRRPEEIREAFDGLQRTFDFEIKSAMAKTRTNLLEHFDRDVQEKLRVGKDRNARDLNRYERMLMRLSAHELGDAALFDEDGRAFDLVLDPFAAGDAGVPLGRYELPRRGDDAHFYRLGHPLAAGVLGRAKAREPGLAEVTFDWTGTRPRVGALEPYVGASGELTATLLTIDALDQSEEYLVLAAVTDDGRTLPAAAAEGLLRLDATPGPALLDLQHRPTLDEIAARLVAEAKVEAEVGISGFSRRRRTKLAAWADDLKAGLEREVRELRSGSMRRRRRRSSRWGWRRRSPPRREVRLLERERDLKTRTLFDAQDEIDAKREAQEEELAAKLGQRETVRELFGLRWKLV